MVQLIIVDEDIKTKEELLVGQNSGMEEYCPYENQQIILKHSIFA
jgi:hypothetical protein